MPSSFGWVDFSEEDRQQMLNVVQLFRERDTRDELGIGTIRDAFADYFFPGTSTIQTRARYMLFVPWIYRELERKRIDSDNIGRRARQDEIRLIYALLDSEDTDGVIGKEAKDKLQRLPSSIYWTGLGAWGIRRFPGSQDQYHRYLTIFYRQTSQKQAVRQEADQELAFGSLDENWDPGLPDPPDEFPYKADLTLTTDEARYLREQIYLHHRDSLLAYLVSESPWAAANFFWEHPVFQRVPADLRQPIIHARNFSEMIFGAALLYNLLLACQGKQAELLNTYRVRFEKWANDVAARWPTLDAWHRDLPQFWKTPALNMARIPRLTRSFVEAWFNLVFGSKNLKTLAEDQAASQLIYHREVQLKRKRARLENPRALERWNGASGSQQIEYRWTIANRFARDILMGLES